MNQHSIFGIMLGVGITAFFVGLTIILAATGPTTPIPVSPNPALAIATECIPPMNPTGAKIKVLDVSGAVVHFWDLGCADLASLMAQVNRIDTAFCQNSVAATPGAAINPSVRVDPFTSTTTGTQGISIQGPNGNFLFPCGNWVNELQLALSQALSGCCL